MSSTRRGGASTGRIPSRGPRRRAMLREVLGADEATAAELIETARTQRQASLDLQTALLVTASRWALARVVDPDADVADRLPGREGAAQVAGDGAPFVAEFCLAELGAVMGMSTASTRSLVGDAVELAHRLPLTWTRLLAGRLTCWRARRIAALTVHLSLAAAAFVDHQVHGRAETISLADLDHIVTEAMTRFDPETAAELARLAAEHRDAQFDLPLGRTDGLTEMRGLLDHADAEDFKALVADVAHQLLTLRPDAPLGVRRALAIGYIGRGQSVPTAVPTPTPAVPVADEPAPTTAQRPSRDPRGRQVVLHLHLTETAVRGAGGLARLEEGRGLFDADRVRDWLDTPAAHVTVKPVLDLGAHLHTDAYDVPDTMRDQAVLRDVTCVFPWCGTAARHCDLDHVIAFETGGPTRTDNLACLCRRHHRLKTHHPGWTYEVLTPGSYRWTSPHGHQFLRDHTGTRQFE